MEEPVYPQQKVLDALRRKSNMQDAQIERLQAENTKLREACEGLLIEINELVKDGTLLSEIVLHNFNVKKAKAVLKEEK